MSGEIHPFCPITGGINYLVLAGGATAIGALPSVAVTSLEKEWNTCNEKDEIVLEGRNRENNCEKVARTIGSAFQKIGILLGAASGSMAGNEYGRAEAQKVCFYHADPIPESVIKKAIILQVVALGCTTVGSIISYLGNRTVRKFSISEEAQEMRKQRDLQRAKEEVKQKQYKEKQARLIKIAELRKIEKQGRSQAQSARLQLQRLLNDSTRASSASPAISASVKSSPISRVILTAENPPGKNTTRKKRNLVGSRELNALK